MTDVGGHHYLHGTDAFPSVLRMIEAGDRVYIFFNDIMVQSMEITMSSKIDTFAHEAMDEHRFAEGKLTIQVQKQGNYFHREERWYDIRFTDDNEIMLERRICA